MKIFLFSLSVFIVLVNCDDGGLFDNNNTDLNGLSQEERLQVPVYRRPGEPPCAARLAPALESMRRHQEDPGTRGIIELRGITLHQPLHGTDLDMYITNMKVKGLGQSHLERCRFSRSNASLSTKLVFGELLARGTIRFRDPRALGLFDWLLQTMECNITMRMRYAPLEVAVNGDPRHGGAQRRATPPRMSARFLPETDSRTEFRGCEEPVSHRRIDGEDRLRNMMRTPAVVRQMETAFLKGIREIMALYMEKQLKSSMTGALMTYMGYTTSYG